MAPRITCAWPAHFAPRLATRHAGQDPLANQQRPFKDVFGPGRHSETGLNLTFTGTCDFGGHGCDGRPVSHSFTALKPSVPKHPQRSAGGLSVLRGWFAQVLTGIGMLHDSLDSAPEAHGPGGTAAMASGHAYGLAPGQNEVSRLLAVIADQIAESDRRNCEALDEMKQRLQQLGADARIARPQVPQEFAPSFSRIEDALSQLAERISTARSDRATAAPVAHNDVADASLASPMAMTASITAQMAPPMALRSAAPAAAVPSYNWASDFSRTRSDAHGPDPFDIIDNGGSLKASEPWSLSEAEALTRVYEDVPFDPEPIFSTPLSVAPIAANIVPMVPPAPEPVVEAAIPFTHAQHMSEPAAFKEPAMAAPSHIDQQWMEARFADLAQHLQASFDETPVHDMLATLDERLTQLEQHLGVSLQDIARRSDVEGLKIVEAHIEEMSRHLEKTQGQLGRLDGIEAQLNEVVEHLAAQFENRSITPAAMPTEEFHRIAEEAATSVATRFAGTMASHASSQPSSTTTDDIAGVRGLLESYIGERRDGDEHNAMLLDTMQQALIRVLDRIDAMENTHARGVPKAAPVSYPLAPSHAQAGQPVMESEYEQESGYYADEPSPADQHSQFSVVPGAEMPAHQRFEDPAAALGSSGPATHALEVLDTEATSTDAPTEELSGIKKLRQDMIADAQRAKLRAAAEQAEAAAKSNEKGGRGRKPANLSGAAGAAKISPKVLIAAAVMLALLGGAWVFGPSSAPQPMVEQVPAAAQPADASAAPAAGTAKTVPGAASAAPAGQSPAAPAVKPQAAAPAGTAPAAANSFVVEPDQEDGMVPAPNKISDDLLDSPPPGIRLRQSAEGVSPMNLAILQRQHKLAVMSNKLGETAVNTMTPAAYMKEVPITAVHAAVTQNEPNVTVPAAVGAETSATQAKSALDLPPVTVGPLSLRLAAAKGDASAEFEAASRLAEGKGTSQNFKEALRWYQRSAAQGFAQAQYRLGTLYERGLGIKADTGMARSWYQRAAEQGNVKAMHNLAVLSASRQSGSPDYATASKWFTQAAERDLQDSQFNLGVLYESGLGVDKDPIQAAKWYTLAARGGDAESVRRRDALKAQLAPQEQAEVAKLSSGFQAVKVEDPLINDARAAGEDWKKRVNAQDQG